MKVLVATGETQGKRVSDSMMCVEGELVWMVAACPESRRFPDGPCSCGRTFRGITSDGETTTAVVRELEGMTLSLFEDALRSAHQVDGDCGCVFDAASHAKHMLSIAERLPEGLVVERRVERVGVRRILR